MERILLNSGWQFSLDGGEFSPVALPHDWLIHDAANLYKNGVGRYRRMLDADEVSAPGQRLFLRFDGVYMDATLFVNGEKAGEWKYGYTAFEFDVTDYIRRGEENRIELEVNYKSPSARWYTGAGIYRDVHLIVKNPCHFISDGIYITTAKRDGVWDYSVTAEVETGGLPYEVRHYVVEAAPYQDWDIDCLDSPVLYHLRSELLMDGVVADTVVTRFGFRETAFDPDRGFFLNGRHVRLNGVCLHHDLGALGSAVHKDAIRRQLTTLREMGVNAIRTSHNPPAEVFMELADEMGFLVMSELLDMWERPKGEFDYARFFHAWVERDAAAWIRRDRNCPSVIMWSVGNEIYDTHADAERGGELLRMLLSYVERHDPARHALPTLCSNYMPWENTQKCADIIKLIGYNYAERLYESHHKAHPDWIIYGGETGSVVQSRGVYHFPLSQPVLSDDDLQCSSLGNSSTSWGAENTEAHILADRNTPFSLGQFIWAGQDYIGEPTPYHTKNSYFGPIDTAGFAKDAYYIFKAAWTESPMVHLYPYWDFSPGQMVDVRAASNAHSVELFLNGVSMGTREVCGKLTVNWRVPYEPGELRAVAYDPNRNALAESARRSFGDTVRLRTETERFGELAFVTITAEDQDGNPVENASNRVRVTVRGGELLGLDNGDSTDYDSYKADNRRLFSGKLLAIVKATGDLRVVAELDRSELRVRKIELTMKDALVSAKVFPQGAEIHGLRWRLTNAGGVDSPAASITAAKDGMSATVAPYADGEVWIRCEAVDEGGQVYLISQLPHEITGKGAQVLNPYTFIAGALYNESNLRLTNGNERGIASARDEDSHIGFAGLDFGSYGSDELTVPLFPLSKEPFTFEIWLGMPLSGGRKLTDVYYDKGMVWNTYIDVTVKLPERIKGPATLCFVFHQKVHLRGFVFTKYEKAFALLHAAENDGLSGDAYEVNGGAVEQIGNNVTLTFTDMDFGEAGASGVTLRTRSKLENNSAHLLLRGEAGQERREVLEVAGTPEYGEARYLFAEKAFGKQTVSFVFLPGSSIDVEWVRFSE